MFVTLKAIFVLVYLNSFVFTRMLDFTSDDWPKYIKDLFYITLLHLMSLATYSSVEKCDDSGFLL